MRIFEGCGTAIITPFLEDGIDYSGLEELIEFQIENQIDALIFAGTTGEAATMTDEEYKSVIKFGIEKVNKRVPVIIGTGSNSTAKAVSNSIYAMQMGADGVLVVNPYYNKGTQHSIVEHYKLIDAAINIPIIVYNVPSRTGLNIEPSTVLELSKLKNIIGIKEASGDINQITEICRLCDKGFSIYSGNDNTVVPVLSLGGIGVISVVSNIIPKEMHNMVKSYLEGDTKKSRDMQLSMNELVKSLFIETNPAPVKYALKAMNKPSGYLRMPLMEIEDNSKQIVVDSMKNYGLEGVLI